MNSHGLKRDDQNNRLLLVLLGKQALASQLILFPAPRRPCGSFTFNLFRILAGGWDMDVPVRCRVGQPTTRNHRINPSPTI